MLTNLLRLFIRNAIAKPLPFLIKAIGLSISICSVFFLFVYLINEKSYNRNFEHSERIYRIIASDTSRDYHSALTALPLGEVLSVNFPEIKNYCRLSLQNNSILKIGEDNNYSVPFVYADSTIKDVFSLNILSSIKPDLLRNKYSVLLSSKLAKDLFNDGEILGSEINIEINGQSKTFVVEGIFESLPRNTTMDFQIIGSITNYLTPENKSLYNPLDQQSWKSNYFSNYVLLKEGVDEMMLSARVNNYLKNEFELSYSIEFQNIEDIYLHSSHLSSNRDKEGNAQNLVYIYVISIIILLTAVINFVILTSSVNLTRLKEFGIRTVLGASKRSIFFITWIEAILSIVFSIIISCALYLILVQYIDKQFQEILSLNNHLIISYLLSLLIILLILAISSGMLIFVLTFKSRPIDILLKNISFKKSKISLNHVFLFFQTAMFIFIIFSSFVLMRQWNYINSKGLGYDPDNVIVVPLNGGTVGHKEALIGELTNLSIVKNISWSDNLPIIGPFLDFMVFDMQDMSKQYKFDKLSVGPQFFKTLDIEITTGKEFSKASKTEQENSVMINEAAAKFLELDDPLNQQVYWKNVLGVVNDFHLRNLYEKIKPVIIFYDSDNIGYLILRLTTIKSSNIQLIKDKIKKFSTDSYVDVKILKEIIKYENSNELKLRNIVYTFAIIAYLIGISGYIGVISYYSRRKMKEIGIRKVYGASKKNLFALLSNKILLIISASAIASLPIAYVVMDNWLSNYADHIDIGFIDLFIPYVSTLILNVLIVSGTIVKAINMNVLDVIRYE